MENGESDRRFANPPPAPMRATGLKFLLSPTAFSSPEQSLGDGEGDLPRDIP